MTMLDKFGRRFLRYPADASKVQQECPSGALDVDDPVHGEDVATEDSATLVSSETEERLHRPVLDIDFKARLVPSTTRGHYHLYLDGLELKWPAYKKLLIALAEAGVIQDGYMRASIARKATYVRRPGVKKGVHPL